MVQQILSIQDELEQLVPSASVAGLLPAVQFYKLSTLLFLVFKTMTFPLNIMWN